MTEEKIALAATAKGLQLGGQEHWCGHDPNRAATWQLLKLGGLSGEGIPTVGEAQDLALGWHQIENEIVCAPAAEGCPWPAVLLEAPLPQLPPQLVVVRLANHAADHIHILGWPDP